jgi:beta-glucanase (GH16 family)
MKFLVLLSLLSFPVTGWAQAGLSDAWVAFNRAGAPITKLQCFTPGNVGVADGNLVITTRAQASSCSSFDLARARYRYTSGFVSMRRFNFLYGTVEFRAKFGGGENTGAWPIVWMQDASCEASDPSGTDNNCNGQEIDIAEILHGNFTAVNQEIHIDNFKHNDGCTAHTSDVSEYFHIYDLVWSPGSLVFKIDGRTTCTISESYVPNAPMYVKADTFVGSYGGPVDKKSLPWTTLIDYVKVTQGSRTVFFDDFNGKPALQSSPAVSLKPLSPRQPPRAFAAGLLERRPASARSPVKRDTVSSRRCQPTETGRNDSSTPDRG